MRPLIIQAPKGKGKDIMKEARDANAQNLCMWGSKEGETEYELVMALFSNKEVETFIDQVNKIELVRITLFPTGVMALYPPNSTVPEQVTNVQLRSPIEIYIAALQSIGSWNGFLSYAVLGAIIVWIGLFTNTVFLLVGAMLIAPFAGPAMNMAIATARGDGHLIGRSLLRYIVSILLTIACTFLLSLLLQQQSATSLMIEQSQISSTAILLPLVAGAAGAINLIQSERSSLVSGAAAGMLVAASLAPPAGVVGMSLAIGEWQMVKGSLFLLVLQLAGINLTGSLIFRATGLKEKGPRYDRGKRKTMLLSLAATVLMLGSLAWWQFHSQPELQRSSLSKRAEEEIHKTLKQYPKAGLVDVNVRFTGANIPNQNTLLCIIYVQAKEGSNAQAVQQELEQKIYTAVEKRLENVTPLIKVEVMKEPTLQNGLQQP